MSFAGSLLLFGWVLFFALSLVPRSCAKEHLDRGVVALPRPGGEVYVGWRLLTSDPEGIAFNVRAMLEHLEGDCVFDTIRIIGGGARSDLWRQIFADVLRKDVLRLSAQQEANTLGAALVGGVAIGAFEDFSVVERYAAVEEVTSFDPEAARIYDEMFHVFTDCYKGLKHTNESLSQTRAVRSSDEIRGGGMN